MQEVLHEKAGKQPNSQPEKLQKAYQQHISALALKEKNFLPLRDIEESRQTDRGIYELLTSKAKEHLEEVCNKEKIKNLNTYASSILRSGTLGEQKNYTLLYTRDLDEQGKKDFIEQIEEYHHHNRLKKKSYAELLKDIKQYITNQNPDMLQNQKLVKQTTLDNGGRD